jgi:hypothetical protein
MYFFFLICSLIGVFKILVIKSSKKGEDTNYIRNQNPTINTTKKQLLFKEAPQQKTPITLLAKKLKILNK